MNKKLIQDLAITGGIYDCICDPYDKLKNGDPYGRLGTICRKDCTGMYGHV